MHNIFDWFAWGCAVLGMFDPHPDLFPSAQYVVFVVASFFGITIHYPMG